MPTELQLSQLNYLLDEFPEQHAFIHHLDNFIISQNQSIEISSQNLIEILQPTDLRTFVLMLHSAQKTGLVEYYIQVNSPSGEKIEQFTSLMEIPLTMIDPDTKKEFTVLLTQIAAIYNINPHQIKPQNKSI